MLKAFVADKRAVHLYGREGSGKTQLVPQLLVYRHTHIHTHTHTQRERERERDVCSIVFTDPPCMNCITLWPIIQYKI